MNDTAADEVREFFKRIVDAARGDLIPKISGSLFVFMPLHSEKDKDVWMALQIGLALMLDRPLIILATSDVYVPARLRQIADLVIDAESLNDPSLPERAAAAVAEMLRKKGVVQ